MKQNIGRILSDFRFTNFVKSDWILMLIYRIRSLEKHSPLIFERNDHTVDESNSHHFRTLYLHFLFLKKKSIKKKKKETETW